MERPSNYLAKCRGWLRQNIRRFSQYFGIELLLKRFPASPTEVEEAEVEFFKNTITEGMTVFDVGANIGQFSTMFSELVGQKGEVHCFEASSQTFQRLVSECSKSRFNNLFLNHLAVSDQPGIVHLYVYDDNHSSWNTLADRPLHDYGIQVDPVATEEVNAVTIDFYCQQHGINNIDLLKIDVEGAEYQVLLGAERMFREKSIKNCIFEFGLTTLDMGTDPNQIDQFIKSIGYKLSNVVQGDPVLLDRVSAKTAMFSMFIARP